MARRVLMICYHYPPIAGSSGYQRTLNFARNLVGYGWEPLVLTVHPRAYPEARAQAAEAGPDGPRVVRAFALDSRRQLAIGGRYPAFFAWPDRWISWWIGAVPLSRRVVREFNPDVIWSTYPIATAHLIASSWQRRLNRPWVADFRDPMSEDNYPSAMQGRLVRRIERTTVARATRIVVTTDGAAREIASHYPGLVRPEKFTTIPNGFDESAFNAAEHQPAPKRAPGAPIELVHSGILYPAERDPRAFFLALSQLRDEGRIGAGDVHVTLRATAHDVLYRPQIESLALGSIISLKAPVPYVEALSEMLAADGLLLFQGSICNNQVPAKAYEYIRAQRPVLALTDPLGDTARLLVGSGFNRICPLDSVEAIKRELLALIEDIRQQRSLLPTVDVIAKFDRRYQAQALADVLNGAAATRSEICP
jgi:Glycosyl transferase 4-like domain